MRALLRVLAIFGAYLAASFAASSVSIAIILRPGVSDGLGMSANRGSVWGPILIFTVAIAIVTALPAVLAITYTEMAGQRSPLFYAIASGVTGFLLGYAIGRGNPPEGAVFAVAGIVAGLVYGALAGRKAGILRSRKP
jgi:hypothetical protein